jgi:hypothetical protein
VVGCARRQRRGRAKRAFEVEREGWRGSLRGLGDS